MTRPIFIIFFLPEKSDTVDVVWVGVDLEKSVAQVGVHSPGLLGLARLLLVDSIKVRLSLVQKKRGLGNIRIFLKGFHHEFHAHGSNPFPFILGQMLEWVGVAEVNESWSLDTPDVIPLGFDASLLEELVDCLHCGSGIHMSYLIV